MREDDSVRGGELRSITPRQRCPSAPRRSVNANYILKDFEQCINAQEEYDRARRVAMKDWPLWRQQLNVFVRESTIFERAIFFLLFVNCVCLSLMGVTGNSQLNTALLWTDNSLTVIFFFEMILKIVARGFLVKPGGYFTTKANLFDFTVVMVTTFGLVQELFFTAAIGSWPVVIATTGRFLRPFRVLSAVRCLRIVVKAVQVSLRRLGDVALITFTISIVFLIIGMQLLGDSMDYRCVTPADVPTINSLPLSSNTTLLVGAGPCSAGFPIGPSLNTSVAELHIDGDHPPQGWWCPWGQYCLKQQSPEYNFVDFANPVKAGVSLATVLALDSWSTISIDAMRAKSGWVSIYFVVVVLTASIVLFNLVLMILMEGFTESIDAMQQHRENSRGPQRRIDLRTSTVSSSSAFNVVCATLSGSVIFRYAAVVVALVNTIIIACMEPTSPLLATHALCLGLLMAEVIVRLLAVGFKAFFRIPLNSLDFAVSLLSIVGILADGHRLSSIAVFRSLNLLELHPALIRIGEILTLSLTSAASNALLMLITNFLFAILGFQLFGGKLCGLDQVSPYRVNTTVCNDVPRDNFDNMGYAIVTVVVLFSGSGWRSIMAAVVSRTSTYAALYFVLAVIIGQFLTLLQTVTELTDSSEEMKRICSSSVIAADDAPSLDAPLLEEDVERLSGDDSVMGRDPSPLPQGAAEMPMERSGRQGIVTRIMESKPFDGAVIFFVALSSIAIVVPSPTSNPYATARSAAFIMKLLSTIFFCLEAVLKMHILGLCCSRNRRAGGRWCNGNGYFGNWRNGLDFVLAILSVISVALYACGFEWSKYIDLARSLRWLSLVSRISAVRIFARIVMKAAPSIAAVGVVAFLVTLLFAICGTQLFGSQLSACTNTTWGDATYTPPLIHSKADCLATNLTWVPFPKNFDSVGMSLLTLFGVNTKDTWKEVLYMTSSVVSTTQAPQGNASPAFVIFSIVYMVVTTFGIINIFLSVLVTACAEVRRVIGPSLYFCDALSAFMDSSFFQGMDLTVDQQDFVFLCARSLFFVRPPARRTFTTGGCRERIRMMLRSRLYDKYLFFVR